MKKALSVLLVLCLVLLSAAPALANAKASLILSGGFAYITSPGSYYIYGKASGIPESKTVTATLYKQSGSSWVYVDSVSNTSSNTSVTAEKYVSISGSGTYKLTVRGVTHNSDGTVTYNYTV